MPVVCGSIVDRRASAEKAPAVDGVPYRALLSLEIPAWEPAACPLCARGEPVVAPGSRHLAVRT